ncbi:MAG TPA: hypothetical protein VF815_01650 [Myxococcaceae bacterium]
MLLVVFASACATPRVVRLDIGQGEPLEHLPPTMSRSVTVRGADFEGALARLMLDEPLVVHPAGQGWVVRASFSPPAGDTSYWLGKALGGPCRPGQPRNECVSLLDDVMGLSSTEKLALGLGLSLQPMRESIARALEDTLTPQFFAAAISAGMVSWVLLAANPEPVFTKVAAVVAAVMVLYLGVDAFLVVVKACQELKRTSEGAVTFEEVEEASQRFGAQVGPQLARVFILALTVVISRGTMRGATSLAGRLPLLPRFAEASAVGAAQVGVNLASVGEVTMVAVVEGNLVISLAPTAVAMATRGVGGESEHPRPSRVSGEELAKLRREFEAIKSKFWKNEATINERAYSPENVARMRNGKPPIGPDGHPMELHHKKPLAEGGSNAFDNLEILTRTGHRLGDSYKKNHPNLP